MRREESLGFRFPETRACEGNAFDVTDHILDLHGPRMRLHKDHPPRLFLSLLLFSRVSLFFFSSFPSRTFASSSFARLSSRISLVVRETLLRPSRCRLRLLLLLLASLSFSLPGLPRRHRPALSRPAFCLILSRFRDTSSRMSKGDEMRRLVGFHGDQPACTGISRLNRRRLSRRALARLANRRDGRGTTRR